MQFRYSPVISNQESSYLAASRTDMSMPIYGHVKGNVPVRVGLPQPPWRSHLYETRGGLSLAVAVLPPSSHVCPTWLSIVLPPARRHKPVTHWPWLPEAFSKVAERASAAWGEQQAKPATQTSFAALPSVLFNLKIPNYSSLL